MTWLRTHAFEVMFALSLVGAVVVLATTSRAQRSDIVLLPDAHPWIIQAVGPNYNPVYVRDGRRIYVVAEDGGVRRCSP